MNLRNKGFTLLELAVVLVIIALLIGGVLAGAQMVRQSEIRATIAQVDKFTAAIRIFNDKYGQLPGDFNNAATFWGTDTGCTTTAFNQVPKTATCNGNGDGIIGTSVTVSSGAITYTNTGYEYEWYRAWQHLADAGLIDGQYSGVGGNVAGTKLLGTSIPATSYPGGGFMLTYNPCYDPSSSVCANTVPTNNFAAKSHHVLEIGEVDPACASGSTLDQCITHAPLFTPADAADIDTKLDDGLPGSGNVLARPSTSTINPNCASSATLYNTGYKSAACGLIIDTGY